jgi:hypothetical protein
MFPQKLFSYDYSIYLLEEHDKVMKFDKYFDKTPGAGAGKKSAGSPTHCSCVFFQTVIIIDFHIFKVVYPD